MWTALKAAHELDTVTNRISLYKQISSLKMKENDDVENHLNEFVSLIQKLTDLGAETDDEWKIGMLFSSLPPSYSTLGTALEARKSDELTWSLIHSKIIDESIRRKRLNEQDEQEKHDEKVAEKVYKLTSKLHCHLCKKDNHTMASCIKLKHWKQFQEFTKMMGENQNLHNKEEKDDERANFVSTSEFTDETTTELTDDEMILCISHELNSNEEPTKFESAKQIWRKIKDLQKENEVCRGNKNIKRQQFEYFNQLDNILSNKNQQHCANKK